ncbi:MAG: pyrimidine dimer DNA glycosylase/endonuclease V [Sulfurimonas sp.]
MSTKLIDLQTFLPYPDLKQSAMCLDWQRLNKQRLESMQIVDTLRCGSKWKSHPAVRMWAGYELALETYMNCCIQEWIRRGYRNNMKLANVPTKVQLPPWFGNPTFHSSHRSNLLRKYPEWYGKYGWTESPDLPYFWPV